MRPLDIAGYLAANGWLQVRNRPGIAQYWTKGEQYEVLLPVERRMDGFESLMAELLKTLEIAENVDQFALADRIRDGSADTVRVVLDSDDTADGTVEVTSASVLVSSARSMLAASAATTVQPRAYYARRRHRQVNDYMRRVRMAPLSSGSFVLRLLSPVPPVPRAGQLHTGAIGVNVDDPFSRRVVATLSDGLSAANTAAEVMYAGIDYENQLTALVMQGLSANLCEAIANTAEAVGDGRLTVGISWSWRRPEITDRPVSFVYNSDRIEAIKEAGRLLKGFAPREEFELLGTIVKLERGPTDLTGRVFVRAFFDESFKSVAITLTDEVYGTAVQAHESRALVACLGELSRDGRQYELRNPRSFRVVDID